MNFDLHLYGETPEELLNVLAHLGTRTAITTPLSPTSVTLRRLPPRSPRASL